MEIEHRIEFMPPCLLRVSPHDRHLWFWGTNILWVGGGVPGPHGTREGFCESDTSLWPITQFIHLIGEWRLLEWNTGGCLCPCSPWEVWTSSVYLCPLVALLWVFRLLILPAVPLIEQLRLTCVLMFPSQPCEGFFPDPFPIPLFVLYTVFYRTRYLPPCTHTIVRVFCFVGIYKQCSLAQATCITLSDPCLPHELPPSAHEFWGLGGGLWMDV